MSELVSAPVVFFDFFLSVRKLVDIVVMSEELSHFEPGQGLLYLQCGVLLF